MLFKNVNRTKIRSNKQIHKTYSGKVILFKATRTLFGYKDDANMGWGAEDFTGEVENYLIEGDHMSIFKGTGAVRIAERLNWVLEEANRDLERANKLQLH